MRLCFVRFHKSRCFLKWLDEEDTIGYATVNTFVCYPMGACFSVADDSVLRSIEISLFSRSMSTDREVKHQLEEASYVFRGANTRARKLRSERRKFQKERRRPRKGEGMISEEPSKTEVRVMHDRCVDLNVTLIVFLPVDFEGSA